MISDQRTLRCDMSHSAFTLYAANCFSNHFVTYQHLITYLVCMYECIIIK